MKAFRKSTTRIQLEFDTPGQRASLAKLVSYELPGAKHTVAYKSGKWDGTKCFLTDTNTLRVGMFKTLFPEHSLVFDKEFKSLSFDDIPLYQTLNIERRDYQLEAINKILQNKLGIINCIMGSGKTLIAAATLSYHLSLDSRNKALFVVYDRNILYQTIKNFEKYGFNVSQFGDGVKDLSGDIVVAVINSLNNIEKPREVLKYVTFVICDEAHHGKSKSSRDMLTKLPNCNYFIGLTATPHVDRSLATAELQSVLGPIIYEYGFSEGVKDGKVAPVKAFFLDTPPDLDIKAQIIERKNYKVIWDTAIKENATRNKQLSDILYYCVELLKTPNLVLVDRVEHGTELFEHLSKKDGIRATTMFGDDDIILREAKKASLQDDTINTLISTVVKEGSDFKISPVIAVNASGRQSFITTLQFLGRITRKNDTFGSFRAYIDLVDNYHPMLRRHSQERIKSCIDFGIDVVICHSMKELMCEIIKHYKACNV